MDIDCEKIKNNIYHFVGKTEIDYRPRKNLKLIFATLDDENNSKVVFKIGKKDDDISREYEINSQIKKAELPGFIYYYCMFTCAHNLETENEQQICESGKENADIIIMPYIGNNTTLRELLQKTDIGKCKEYVKQVIENMANAFIKIGFVHKDLHDSNIMIDGDNAIIIDFDVSVCLRTHITRFFWEDMEKLFTQICKYKNYVNLKAPILNYISSVKQKQYEEPEFNSDVHGLVNVWLNNVGGRRKRRTRKHKKLVFKSRRRQ